jgi:sugar lactone lactonase YvrE
LRDVLQWGAYHGIVAALFVILAGGLLVTSGAAQGSAPVWQQLIPAGGPPTPHMVANRAVGYDPASNRLLVFGGREPTGSGLNDLWVLIGADGSEGTPRWQEVVTRDPPAPRSAHVAAYDAVNNRLIVHSGCLGLCSPIDPAVYVLSNANGLGGLPAWERLTVGGDVPPDRIAHTAVYDPTSNRLIVFGGGDCCGGRANDTWVLTNANGLGGPPSWERLLPSSAPSVRAGHTAVYDPTTNRMIVMGGGDNTSLLSDVWVLVNANGLGGPPAWHRVGAQGTQPPARGNHVAAYDPATNRMIIAGGHDGQSELDDVWVLSHANGLGGEASWSRSWTFPSGPAPTPRVSAHAAYHESSNRLVVYGGTNANRGLDDVWVLLNANAVPAQPPSAVPTPTRTVHPAPAPLAPGDVLVVDRGAGGIVRIDPETGAQSLFSVGQSFVRPRSLAVAPSGEVFVSDIDAFGGGGGIIRVDPQTGGQAVVATGGSFVEPLGVAITPDGDLLVADADAFGGGGGILRVNPRTGAQTVVAQGGRFVAPIGVTLAANGDVLVTDFDALGSPGAIFRIDPLSGTQTIVASGGHFAQPAAVAVEPGGDLLVVDALAFAGACAIGCGGLIRVDRTTGVQTPLAFGDRFLRPQDLALASDGSILVTNHGASGRGSAVLRVDPVTGAQTVLSAGGYLSEPTGIAIVPPPAQVAASPQPGSFTAVVRSSLTLQDGFPALRWSPGGSPLGYQVARWSTDGLTLLPPAGGPLAAAASSYVDTSAPPGGTAPASCYAVLSLDAEAPPVGGQALCLFASTARGREIPTSFSIQLDERQVTTLTWAGPPWHIAYRLTALAPDGSVRRVVTLTNGERMATHETRGAPTCYRLELLDGLEAVGATDLMCAVPVPVASDEPIRPTTAEMEPLVRQVLGAPLSP